VPRSDAGGSRVHLTAMVRLQQAATASWEGGIQATGGAIVPNKSFSDCTHCIHRTALTALRSLHCTALHSLRCTHCTPAALLHSRLHCATAALHSLHSRTDQAFVHPKQMMSIACCEARMVSHPARTNSTPTEVLSVTCLAHPESVSHLLLVIDLFSLPVGQK